MRTGRGAVAAALSLMMAWAVAWAPASGAATRVRIVDKPYTIDMTAQMTPFTGTTRPGDKPGVACSYRGPGTQCITVSTQPREGAVTVRATESGGGPIAFALLGDWNSDGTVAESEVLQFCGAGGLPLPIRTKPVLVNVAFGGKTAGEVVAKGSNCVATFAQKGTIRLTFLR